MNTTIFLIVLAWPSGKQKLPFHTEDKSEPLYSFRRRGGGERAETRIRKFLPLSSNRGRVYSEFAKAQEAARAACQLHLVYERPQRNRR